MKTWEFISKHFRSSQLQGWDGVTGAIVEVTVHVCKRCGTMTDPAGAITHMEYQHSVRFEE